MGVLFLRIGIVKGSVSRLSKGFSTTDIGAVGGGRFVSSQYSGIRFARFRDCKTSSSLAISMGRGSLVVGMVMAGSAHGIVGAPP